MKNFLNNGVKLASTSQLRMNFKSLLLLLFFATFGFVGCKKDTFEQTDSVETLIESETTNRNMYFLDGAPVSEGVFNLQDDNLFYAYTRDVNDHTQIINILAFTSRDSYIQWGESTNNPVEKKFQLEDYVKAYSLENNLYEIYDNTGRVPQRHIDHLNNYYAELFPEANSSRLLTTIRKNCTSGNTWVISGVTLFMPPGFNNSVTSFEHVAIGGFLNIYDKSLLRKNLGSFWNWGLSPTCFEGPLSYLNDRMSSCISVSI